MAASTAQIIPYKNLSENEALDAYGPKSGNFAPRRPLDEMAKGKRTSSPSTLESALLKKYLNYKERDREVWEEYSQIGRMVSNLRTGKLLLMRSITDGRYLFVKKDGRFSDNKTVGGLFQFYSTKLTAEWISSRPEREPVCPSDDDQIESFISDVQIIQDNYDRKFFTDLYETNESLSAQDYGTWITRFRYDPDEQDVCCELLDFPACRWDIRFTAEESPYFLYQSKCSNAVLEHMLNADVAEDGEDSDYYGIRVVEQIAKQGGNVAGEGKDNPWGNSWHVDGENVVTEMWMCPEAYCDIEIEQDTPTLGGKTIKKGSLLNTFPDGLCVVGLHGMQTIIGLYPEKHEDHIVSGRFHIQPFSGVGKGVSDAVDVKKEMDDLHSQTMAYIKAHSTPATYYNQDMISEEQARNIGKPRKIIPVDFSNAPDGVNSINQAIQVVTPQNPASSIFEYKEILNNWLQMSFQVTDFSNGLPGVDNKTATGAKIGDANADMILVPQHRNKADHRRRADKVIYNLFKKFVNKEKFFQTRAKNGITAGKYLSGSQFDGVDIDFEIVANSEVPQTTFQQRDNLSQFLQFTGGVAGLIQSAQMNPDITGEIASAFGVKNLSIPDKKEIARICRRRIEQVKKILETEMRTQQMMSSVLGSLAPPFDNSNLSETVISQLSPPISPYEPFSREKAAWMSELLDSDEMQYAPIELRYTVEGLIDRQLEAQTIGQAKLAQDASMGYVMGNLPEILGQHALDQSNQALENQFQQQQQQQQAAQQQQAQQQQAQGQLQLQQAQTQQQQQQLQLESQANAVQNQQDFSAQAAQTQIDQGAAHADHLRQLAVNDQQHNQAMQLENVSHANKIQQLQTQAKLKPKPTSSK
jgi:hypothetical protein